MSDVQGSWPESENAFSYRERKNKTRVAIDFEGGSKGGIEIFGLTCAFSVSAVWDPENPGPTTTWSRPIG